MKAVKEAARRHDAEVNLGHPVRTFVIVMVTIGLLLLVVQWSGVFLPRVVSTGGSASEVAADRWIVRAQVVNEGPLAIDVVGVEWPGVGGAKVATLPTPFEPITIDSGETGSIEVVVIVDCSPDHTLGGLGPLELEVRSPVGIRRTLTFPDEAQGLGTSC
jgi:hypothetical protein